jgi:hypothetical protein
MRRLTYGALSVSGDAISKDRFGDLVPGSSAVPFNDLAALEKALSTRDVAAFIVKPIQGKGVNLLDDIYLRGIQDLMPKVWHPVCRRRNPVGAWPHRTIPRDRTLGRRRAVFVGSKGHADRIRAMGPVGRGIRKAGALSWLLVMEHRLQWNTDCT